MTDKIFRIFALSVVLLTGVSACSTGDSDTVSVAQDENAIGISETVTRAVKFNADSRKTSLARTMAENPKNLNKNRLPSLAASAGYPMRSSDYGISAKKLLDGKVFTDNEAPKIDLAVSYNILDYAINYAAVSDEDGLEKSAQRLQNRTLQNLIHEAKTSFWKAAVAKKNKEEVDHLIELLRYELAEAAKVENNVNLSVDSLEYQKELHAMMRQLMGLRKEIAAAELDFALLASIPPDEEVSLKISENIAEAPATFIPELSKLENQALINRSETAIGDYNVKMNASEVRKEAARILPKINLGENLRYNPNGSYSVSWQEDISEVAFNIINVPLSRADADTDLGMKRKQRIAVSMGILDEVNIAYRRVKDASEEMDASSALQVKYQKAWDKAAKKEKEGSISRPDLVKAIANKVVGDLKRDLAFAELKSAESGLNLASGLDFIKGIDTSDTLVNIHKIVVNGLLNEQGVNPLNVKKVTEKVYVAPTVKIDAPETSPAGSSKDKWAEGDWLASVVKDEEELAAETKIEAKKAGNALDAEISHKETTVVTIPPAAKSAAKQAGNEALQIGSFADMESAENYWANMQLKYSFLTDYPVEYRQAKIGTRSVNRVFIKGNSFQLKALCKKIPEAKDCIIRK